MKFQIMKHIKSTIDEGELVLLNIKKGTFYGIDSTGSKIWNLIEKGKTFDEILDELRVFYNVPLSELHGDIELFIYDLMQKGLVKKNAKWIKKIS